jgi:hypothetical protein
VPLSVGIIRCSSAFPLLLIDLYVSIIELTISSYILFVVICSSSGIISGDNSCVISTSIGLIGRYLNVILYVVVNNIVLS